VPTPTDAVLVHDAHVIFANGAGLEADLDEMLDSAGGDAVSVHLSDGLELRALTSTDEHQEQELQGHEQEDLDPHVWFSVPNVMHWVDSIEQTLSTLDPANAETYEQNAREYSEMLDELDTWVREQVALVPESRRKLVTNHPSFGYLVDQYGLVQVGAFYPISPSSEPSAQDIAALEDAIRKVDVPAVFAESTVNPSLAEQVARDAGIKLVPLYTGSLGGPGSGAETYIDLMRYDVEAIVDALH
jgi:manganese/iron transport system substrate-binding protein